jgi:hypothetical protein
MSRLRPIWLVAILLLTACVDPAPGIDGITYNAGKVIPDIRDGIGGVRPGALWIIENDSLSLPDEPRSGLGGSSWAMDPDGKDRWLEIEGHRRKVLQYFDRPDFVVEPGSGYQWVVPNEATRKSIETEGAIAAMTANGRLFVFRITPQR